MTHRVGLVGARGYVGAELARLLTNHPHLRLDFASTRAGPAAAVRTPPADAPTLPASVQLVPMDPREAARQDVDVLVLALPNGHAAALVADVPRDRLVVDLSADHRFDNTFVYGLVEHQRARIAGARRIANPGCYATAAQLALQPFVDVIVGAPHVFGVSGYSGAGTAPSDKNDPAQLHDNLMPYALIGHLHEREISAQLGVDVAFMPHVAPFFRGITLTVSFETRAPLAASEVMARYETAYAHEPLLVLHGQQTPLVRDVMGQSHVHLGGIHVDEPRKRVVVVATIDNLLKGAATQALQNINVALGFHEFAGIAA